MTPFGAIEWCVFIFALRGTLEESTALRHTNGKATCHEVLSNAPIVVEDEDPYSSSVRVLADAIKRQVARNAQDGHDLIKQKVKELEKHEHFHADNLSQKLKGFEHKLEEAEDKAEEAEEQIDSERVRHANAKQEIEEAAENVIGSLREEEDEAVAKQHRAESEIEEAEKELEKEEAELKSARKHHHEVLGLEKTRENQVQKAIEAEKEEEMADEEAAEAREEVAEGETDQPPTQEILNPNPTAFYAANS